MTIKETVDFTESETSKCVLYLADVKECKTSVSGYVHSSFFGRDVALDWILNIKFKVQKNTTIKKYIIYIIQIIYFNTNIFLLFYYVFEFLNTLLFSFHVVFFCFIDNID